MITCFPLQLLEKTATPCYLYDLGLLRDTLTEICRLSDRPDWRVHYAVKANSNPEILDEIRRAGLGIDAVSGGEIALCLDTGFKAEDIVFAGVGKSDEEILLALRAGIGSFNVESVEELHVISELASRENLTASVALRVNPNIDAHTHKYITTGLAENKFGIDMDRLDETVDTALSLPGVNLNGLHFHIGSQITITKPFELLCTTIRQVLSQMAVKGVNIRSINVGGGLGVDYADPDAHPIADFESYFKVFADNLPLQPGQTLHFELGRSIVAQCGSLICRCLYVKHGVSKDFVILDAGFSELIRPALYQAYHRIDNLSALGEHRPKHSYDVVGPICESSDCFGEEVTLPETRRGDLFAIRSAGAYGESMSSHYNCRHLRPTVYIGAAEAE